MEMARIGNTVFPVMKVWVIACLVALAYGFVPSKSATKLTSIRHAISLYSRKGSPNDGRDDLSEDDENLLEELRSTKKELFGADIPPTEELQDAAQNSEDAFLAAMLEQTQQFQRIKSEEGSEKAIEVFMERIQEADEASKLEDQRKVEDMERMLNDTDKEGDDEKDITWQ